MNFLPPKDLNEIFYGDLHQNGKLRKLIQIAEIGAEMYIPEPEYIPFDGFRFGPEDSSSPGQARRGQVSRNNAPF